MQQRQINKPIAVNLDKSKKYLSPTEAFYMLNRERNINGTGTLGKTTPLVSNYLACQIQQPTGNNYRTGSYFSNLTNELYWWTWNSNGVNFIARLNGDGSCEIVYDGDCLPLSAAPEHAIEQWRAYLKYDRFCAHQGGKQLVWTDGTNPIGQIDVEASIATNSFTTEFFDICTDDCAAVQMCVPEPCGALEGEFITLEADEVDLTNHMVDVGIKVRFQHVYYDQRQSEWSSISTLYYQDSRGCFDGSEGFPRCMKFRLPVGNPLVDKIRFAYSTDNGLNWKLSDTIEKYQPYTNAAQQWYERELADLDNFSEEDCAFDYVFCNDKGCAPIDPEATSRTFNPMPREPQGLFPIKDRLAFYNYLKGNCPMDGSEAAKFEIGINCANDNCVEEFATVTVRAIVNNRLTDTNGFIYRHEGNNINDPDDENDVARFGAIGDSNGGLVPDGYQQQFLGGGSPYKIRNFIAYIEGTNYWTQMEQWLSSPNFVTKVKTGMLSGMGTAAIAILTNSVINGGNFYYQEAKFKVPKGTKGFIRLASHHAQNGIPTEGQDTSTFLAGTIPSLTAYSGNSGVPGLVDHAEELYFDTCSGDVTISDAFVIDDMYRKFETGSHTSCAYAGYLTDANNKPVEGAEIQYNGSVRSYTDHNGFYHFYLYGDENERTITVQVKVETGCVGGFNQIKAVVLNGNYGTVLEVDIQITALDVPIDYATNYFEIVNIPIKDCDNLPIGGIRVAISGSKYQVSDAVTGVATFHVRNYSTRNRSVRAVVMDVNACFTLDCSNNCNPCLPSTSNTPLSACFQGTPYVNIPTSTNLNKEPALLTKKGLKAGGRYPFGFVVKGSCGKQSAVYPASILTGSLPELDNFMNIPKTQEKGVLSFCSYTYDGTGMVLPDWAECVSIVRGTNVNNYELQWVVDKIERTADGKIKLTIQSLNDYNARYNFETNTLYQYAKGDRVEFINNGDGSTFDVATFGLLNYQILSPFHDVVISGEAEQPADFFNQILIDDDGQLDDLTVGAKIELQRPADCTVEPIYYEIAHLELVNMSGQIMLANPTGTFTTFDTFIVIRQIEGKAPLQSNPPQQFEHKFPSDFWGQAVDGFFLGLSDVGKVHFVNKFENERRFGRNITLNSPTVYNRFGDIEKTLDAPEQGDLTAMALYDGKIGLGVGEFDNFLFQISDEFLRVGSGGIVQAAPVDSLISDPEPKISGQFGCRYAAVGSVYFGDGYANWIDSAKAAYVKHDFNIARDISDGKFRLWVKKTVQFMENFNKTAPSEQEKYRFCTGFNFHTGALQLTVKALPQPSTNNEQEPFIVMRSTLLIHPITEELLTFASYTGEGYGNLKISNATGCAFVNFYLGQPYIHSIIPTTYNSFFGQPCDTFVGVAINANPDKVKRPISFELQDEIRWYVVSVKVDETSFFSFIPPVRVVKTENKWNSSFLYDLNSQGGIYGTNSQIAGKGARGYFCAVTFVRDQTDALKWNTVDNAKRIIFDELDLILFKYMDSESSGFTGNV